MRIRYAMTRRLQQGARMCALRSGAAAILAIAAGLPIGTAVADGVIAKPPDPYIYVAPDALPLTYNWTGFYIGGNVGAATSSTDFGHDHILNPCNFFPFD